MGLFILFQYDPRLKPVAAKEQDQLEKLTVDGDKPLPTKVTRVINLLQ